MRKTRIFSILLTLLLVVGLVFSPEAVSAKTNKAAQSTKITKVTKPVKPKKVAKPTKITLNAKTKTLYTNQTFELKVAKVKPTNASVTVTWSSSNTKVATVDANGVVTAIKKGNAKITARFTTDKKVKASCTINVKTFKPSKITAKVIMINSSKDYLRTAGYQTKKITSYTELKAFIKEACDKYVAAGYGTKKSFYKSKFYVRLKKYSKGFFKTKVLYLLEGSTVSDKQKVKVKQVTRIQDAEGDIIAKLSVTYSAAPTDPNAKLYYQQYFVEVKDSTAKTLKGVKLSK